MTDNTIYAQSEFAQKALELVKGLQSSLASGLSALDSDTTFEPIEWSRDSGQHGGGVRLAATTGKLFNCASVNISQVHYDDCREKKLGSASAISTIIHPNNPHAPSMHMHISWTEMKNGQGYWRIMADLNPSLDGCETSGFVNIFESIVPALAVEGFEQGDRYFYIPALKRHRGVSHFYLENYNSGDFEQDSAMAQTIGEAVIQYYCAKVKAQIEQHREISAEDVAKQLAYHTLYFFQVLTLDRGTTSGLLVHNQNDTGILASLPARVNRDLLKSWLPLMQRPQEELLAGLIGCLGDEEVVDVDTFCKKELCDVVRAHYQKYPEAMKLQARGNVIPPTVNNHK